MRPIVVAAVMLVSALCAGAEARAQQAPAGAAGGALMLDRVAVRWYAPETGGVDKPQYIFARELAFEARLEALADPDLEPGSFQDRHVRAALDRHIAETLLARLPIDPAPKPTEVAARAEAARASLLQRVRGRERLSAAMRAEGIGSDELDAMLRRQARASLYLDRMVAPMLEPSEYELKAALRSGATPFKDRKYDEVALELKRWYVGVRLAQALDAYYQNARSRVVVSLMRGK